MAEKHRIAESFLCVRKTFNVGESEDEFLDVSEHSSCVEALQLARSWLRLKSHGVGAEVWVGDFQIFDGEHVGFFDLAHKHRASLAPVAPGRYGYAWSADGDDYTFVLVKPGAGAGGPRGAERSARKQRNGDRSGKLTG